MDSPASAPDPHVRLGFTMRDGIAAGIFPLVERGAALRPLLANELVGEVQIEFLDEGIAPVRLAFEEGAVVVEDGECEAPDVVVSGRLPAVVALTTAPLMGGIPSPATKRGRAALAGVAGRRVKITGNRRFARKLLRLLALCLGLVALAAPQAAQANGDPASDVLYTQNVFLPYKQPSKGAAKRLKDAAKRAQKTGYKVKVAVIGSEADLGAIPQAFNKPQQYADFLAGELRTLYGPRGATGLLVVMPAGAGVAGRNFTPAERRAARTVEIPSNADSDKLVKAATNALQRMAAAAGKPIGSGDQGGVGAGGAAAVIALAVLVLLAGLVAALKLRGRQAPSVEAASEPDAS